MMSQCIDATKILLFDTTENVHVPVCNDLSVVFIWYINSDCKNVGLVYQFCWSEFYVDFDLTPINIWVNEYMSLFVLQAFPTQTKIKKLLKKEKMD